MAHSHIDNHGDDHGHSHAANNIRTAFFLNLGFALVELVGGVMTNSVAILSDALHDFGDSLSLGVSWYLQGVSSRGRDKSFSYGYRRFSLLGALFISVVLIVGALFIVREGIERLIHPEAVNAQGMLALAVLGIAVNGAAAWRLSRGDTMNERAIYLHVLEDVLGWIAVLVASVVMLFVDIPILDPLLSMGIAVWVLRNVYTILRDTLKIVLQYVPESVDLAGLQDAVQTLEVVESVHDVHLWSLDGQWHVLTLHVVVNRELSVPQLSELKCRIRELCAQYAVPHVTIEIENVNDACALCDC